MFSAAVARSNFAAAAPAAAAALGLSVAQLSHLHAAFLLGYFAGHLPAGFLSDKFGGARMFFSAAVAWLLTTLAHAAVGAAPGAAAVPFLAALRFAIGVFTAATVPALGAALTQLLPEDRRASATSISYGACERLRLPLLL
jgi:MFS family permease